MKIMVIGYSGSGKSTLATNLGDILNIKTFFLDKVQFKTDFIERDTEEKLNLVKNILKLNSSWIIDGNYRNLCYEQRLNEADEIIFMNFNRFNCLYRIFKRYNEYRGKSRPSITEGCLERINFEFILWILFQGRSKNKIANYDKIQSKFKEKVTVINNQKELDEYISEVIQNI